MLVGLASLAFKHLSVQLLELISLLNTELLEVVSLLHRLHKILETHAKRQSAILDKRFKEVITEVPSIPGVDSGVLVTFYGAEVELVSIAAFQEERARKSSPLWCIG